MMKGASPASAGGRCLHTEETASAGALRRERALCLRGTERRAQGARSGDEVTEVRKVSIGCGYGDGATDTLSA